MLTKLAVKNAKNAFKDSIIYFITLVLGVSIFYIFNSIYAQEKIMSSVEYAQESLKAIGEAMSYVSVAVAVILAFLVVYANNFFIKRRKKEFGIYLTLGLSGRQVTFILIVETVIMGIVALGIGIVLGILGSQLMSIFTAKMFEINMSSLTFIIAYKAIWKSILYFAVIFLLAMAINVFTIGRLKLIDLLYGKSKSERLKIKNTKISMVLLVTSLALLWFAYYEILDYGFVYPKKMMLSIISGSLGTFLFFVSISSMLMVFVKAREKTYFRGLNMFTFRQLGSRINTNVISITVVCIALLVGAVSVKAIIAFMSIYMGITFMIACASILSIQQLSEVDDNKHRYGLLEKIGADKKLLNKALFRQIVFYFALPLTLALIHAVVGLIAVNRILEDIGILGMKNGLFTTGVFVIIIYSIYFIFTYIGSKKIINREL